jgi:hypothetical protein
MKIKKFNEMNIDSIFDIILSWISKNNEGSVNPYHNNEHLSDIYKNCIEISNYENIDDANNLLVAALFHDVNHSGGKYTDDVNIKNSVNSFLQFCYENKDIIKKYNIDINLVSELIKCTQFPYTVDPKNKLEEILRDADRSILFNDDFDDTYKKVIVGISKEQNISIRKQLENQIKFVENLKYYTQYMNNKLKRLKDIVISKYKEKLEKC